MRISERIKQYRRDNNLSQPQLGELLHVSKQAISKWENDRCLPDVSLYPTICKLLGISVDQLMSEEAREKPRTKRTALIIVMCCVLVAVIAVAIILVVTAKSDGRKGKIAETEESLQVELPKIIEYSYIDYSPWAMQGNTIYPSSIYYFVFENGLNETDDRWLNELDQELSDSIPIGARQYLDTCDCFLLVDLTTRQYNVISLDGSVVHHYVLYCPQQENMRLIAICFSR